MFLRDSRHHGCNLHSQYCLSTPCRWQSGETLGYVGFRQRVLSKQKDTGNGREGHAEKNKNGAEKRISSARTALGSTFVIDISCARGQPGTTDTRREGAIDGGTTWGQLWMGNSKKLCYSSPGQVQWLCPCHEPSTNTRGNNASDGGDNMDPWGKLSHHVPCREPAGDTEESCDAAPDEKTGICEYELSGEDSCSRKGAAQRIGVGRTRRPIPVRNGCAGLDEEVTETARTEQSSKGQARVRAATQGGPKTQMSDAK
ncbi:hypothetical protein DFH09DRAFT_1094631 [Mycena vulgaris]|nr:hypothetical protein DFH09DRAFT_1094631 [Mycena vulgaris]